MFGSSSDSVWDGLGERDKAGLQAWRAGVPGDPGPVVAACRLHPLPQDFVFTKNTDVQAARLGNIVHAMITYRRKLDREQIKPVSCVRVEGVKGERATSEPCRAFLPGDGTWHRAHVLLPDGENVQHHSDPGQGDRYQAGHSLGPT